ncbi:MAG: PmoA family protein [Planctomycetota bacterium]|jgi:hypothetical protein|nr:PmoA family protein [Planctomycetota bacterium]MDA1201043.1 PmoA family protein [Planctomycetota bacterium]
MRNGPVWSVPGCPSLTVCWFLLLVALAAGGPATGVADEPAAAWQITVAAGDVDRSNLPLRCPLAVPAKLAAAPVRILLADGSQVDGQLTEPALGTEPRPDPPAGTVDRDVIFVLPSLPAGESLEVTAQFTPAPADNAPPPRLVWTDEPTAASLMLAGKPLVRYEKPAYAPADEATREATYKPFHHVFDPVTGIRLTKGDGGLYTHHRGIFFGYNRISHGDGRSRQSDCWHCRGQARQEHRETILETAGPVAGVQRVAIDWIGSDGKPLVAEARELDVVPVAGGTVIDFGSRLVATEPVRLDGDPQHAGVHFRASNEVADATKGDTYYLRPDGKGKPGEERNWPQDKTYVDAAWHAASFVVGGQRYTVVRANRPTNPGEARMSERSYARFGSYFAHDLEPGRPLLVGYRFWVQPGEMAVAEAARIAADYARPARLTVRPATAVAE